MNVLTWLETASFARGDFALQLTVTLLHFLWQGLAIALVVFFAVQTMSLASARARYVVSFAGLLLMAACAPVTFSVVTWPQIEAADAGAMASATLQAEEQPELVIVDRSTVPLIAETDISSTLSIASTVDSPPPSASREPAPATPAANDSETTNASPLTRYAPFAAIAYLLGVAFMLVRLALALCGGQRLRQSAKPVDHPGVLLIVRQQARRIGLKVAPLVCYCERVAVPVVVGILRPTILLPASLVSGLTPDQLQALITHELSHIRRCDLVANLAQRVIESLLFFHPAVWYVSRRVSAERENCCDDLVVSAGCDRVQYAGTLIRVAEAYAALNDIGASSHASALAANGKGSTEFNRRIVRLLYGESRVRLSRGGTLVVLLVLVAVLIGPTAAPPKIELLFADEQRGVGDSGQDTPDKLQIAARLDLYGDPLPDGAVMRLGTTRLRHPWRSSCAAFSPDGRLLASGGNRSVVLWDASTGKRVRKLEVGSDAQQDSHSITFSPDGKQLAVGGRSGSIRVFAVPDGKELFRKGHTGGGEIAVAYFPGGDTLASFGGNGDVVLWDAATGAEQTKFQHGFARRSDDIQLAISPDGSLVAASSESGIRIWNVETEMPLTYIAKAHDRMVTGLAFSSDGETLYSSGTRLVLVGGNDAAIQHAKALSQIRTWDVKTGKLADELIKDEEGHLAGVTLGSDGGSLITVSEREVVLFDLALGDVLRVFELPEHRRRVLNEDIALSKNGKTLAVSMGENAIQLLDLVSGQSQIPITDAHESLVRAVAYSPDGGRIVTGSSDGTVRIWDSTTGGQIRLLDYSETCMNLMSVVFSPDGETVAAAGNYSDGLSETTGAVKLWNAASGDVLREFQLNGRTYFSLAFSSNGEMLAAALMEDFFAHERGEVLDCPIHVFHTDTGKPLMELKGHRRTVTAVAFSTDDQTLVSLADGEGARRWRLRDGNLLESIPTSGGNTAAVSHGATTVVTSRGDWGETLTITNFATGKVVSSFDGIRSGFGAHALDISNDGRLVVSGCQGDTVYVWDMATGEQLLEIPSPDANVFALAFDPTGERVVTGMNDGTALVWDVSAAAVR
jgi:WD40 repeat protein/beta-lactamase regulating signal transducer with metallopeptidase domain